MDKCKNLVTPTTAFTVLITSIINSNFKFRIIVLWVHVVDDASIRSRRVLLGHAHMIQSLSAYAMSLSAETLY
jgi:hypothetical protein